MEGNQSEVSHKYRKKLAATLQTTDMWC